MFENVSTFNSSPEIKIEEQSLADTMRLAEFEHLKKVIGEFIDYITIEQAKKHHEWKDVSYISRFQLQMSNSDWRDKILKYC